MSVDKKIVKKCACGIDYTREQWQALELIGFQFMAENEPLLELRNCSCTSTMHLAVTMREAIGDINRTLKAARDAREANEQTLKTA